jgi:hypothetical protein
MIVLGPPCQPQQIRNGGVLGSNHQILLQQANVLAGISTSPSNLSAPFHSFALLREVTLASKAVLKPTGCCDS